MEYFKILCNMLVSKYLLFAILYPGDNMEKVKTSVSLDKDVYAYIQKLAETERLNLSLVINRYFYQLMVKEKEGK